MSILAKTFISMALLSIDNRKLKPAVVAVSVIFFAFAIFFFLPVKVDHKVTFPLTILFIASLWLLPWQMSLSMLFSGIGDYFGSCDNFILQMSFFALAHVCMIWFFTQRYFTKVEKDRKLTGKAKGYMAMVFLFAIILLCVVFTRVVPQAEPGVIRIGVSIYACLICGMLVTALLQRSSLYAVGAVLFVFSDFIIAWHKFVEPVPCRTIIVMSTYYAAQWLLFIRSTPYRIKNQIKLMRF